MEYDVIIVGARVTGAILGTLLGGLGHRVLILEKADFPSDTLSTAFFRSPTLYMLERIGVLEKVKESATPMTEIWDYMDGHILQTPVEEEREHLRFFLCVRRVTFDWILYKRLMREPNVEIRLNAKVQDVIWEDGQVAGVRWKDQHGKHEATSRVVVGADGFYSTVAKLLDPPFENYFPVQRFMYYVFYSGLDLLGPAVNEHHFAGNSLAYVFPTDDNLVMAALSLPIAEFAGFKKTPLKSFTSHLESLPMLAPRLSKAKMVSELYGSGNIPCYQRHPFGPGWALVGDAQQVLDPWSGMGMDHGSTHAGMLAIALNDFLNGDAQWETAMKEYHIKIRTWSEKSYHRTTTFAADVRPMVRSALIKRGLIMPDRIEYAI